jgi:hypothetical protein
VNSARIIQTRGTYSFSSFVSSSSPLVSPRMPSANYAEPPASIRCTGILKAVLVKGIYVAQRLIKLFN